MFKINCSAMDRPPLEEVNPPSPSWTIEDLPPEVLTKILEFATLDSDRTTIFGCRQVNSRWKDIMDSVIEKRIVEGEFPICPEMNIVDVDSQHYVPLSSTMFPDSRNPFPFNSVLFHGTTIRSAANNVSECSQFPTLSLPAFTSRFGGNLTSFALHDQTLSINTLVVILGAMPSLKLISFSEVWERYAIIVQGKRDPVSIPSPPPLPSLTTLQVKAHSNRLPRETENNIIYLWLIASYADQLVRLDLFKNLFVPLQPSHEYTYVIANGETRPIATTSESAFRNLKELKVLGAAREFLIHSETPALQHFSVMSSEDSLGEYVLELDDVITFIDKCSSSLETLVLNNLWDLDVSMSEETVLKLDGRRPLYMQPMLVGFPRLKTIMLRYPRTDVSELILSEFLVKFPALQRLQLLHFGPHRFYQEDLDLHHTVKNEAVEFGNENNQNAAEVATLKERLSLHLQHMSGISNILRLDELRFDRVLMEADIRGEELDELQIQQMNAEYEAMERIFAVTLTKRATIFNRLVALGENTKQVMVEQLLERRGFWNTCPVLRIVSVSSTARPIGDVCVFRRPDDA